MSKQQNDQAKSSRWDAENVMEDSSDLEDSWAGEEVMFDGSPSSGKQPFFGGNSGWCAGMEAEMRTKKTS